MKMKKIISKILCFCGVAVVCVSSAFSFASFADGVEDDIMSGKYRNPYMTKSGNSGNIYDDTRYVDSSPAQSVEDFINGVGQGIVNIFNQGINIVSDFYKDNWSGGDAIPAWDAFLDMGSDALYSLVHAQRVKDLVDYANQSTTSLTIGENVVSFIAKRKLLLSFSDTSQYEVDTMYYWRDFNHTESNDFTGVQIGNFFMRPNTIYVTRQFSNGDFKCFYCDATQFDLRVTQANADFVNSRFVLQFQAGKTYYITNPDGSTEQFTFNDNSSAAANSSLRFLDLNASTTNSTVEDDFARQAFYFPKFNEYITDGILTNIQLMCNNASNSDGSMMRPNNYSGSADGWEKWFMSSGAFIDNGTNSLVGVTQTFTTNNNNYDARKPPAVYNFDNRMTTNNELTTENVSNYSDYGVSYNYINNEFELDINALAAGLAGQLVPQLQGNFGLVYDNQPDIGSSDWTQLPNNYNNDFNTTIVEISDIIDSLVPDNPAWNSPDFPRVTTYNIVVKPVMPTITEPIPQYLPTCASNLFGLADSILGGELLPLFVALALFGLAVGILM